MADTTTNFSLYKPDEGENNWASEVNDNFDTIDTNLTEERIEDIVDALLSAGASITLTYDDANDALTVAVDESSIDHDALTNFVANEHIDHSGVNIQAGKGLVGGGDLTATRTIDAHDVTTQTSAYTASENDIVLADASASGFTVTLPNPSESVVVQVKKIDSSSNAVTIATPGTETIDDKTNLTITGQYVSRTIVSDGNNYWVV